MSEPKVRRKPNKPKRRFKSTGPTPEAQVGTEIERLRKCHGWSRSCLVRRIDDVLDPDDPLRESITEAFVARLETGRMARLPRDTLEAICEALECDELERTRLLLLADRNQLYPNVDNGEPTRIEEMLNHVMHILHRDMQTLLSQMVLKRCSSSHADPIAKNSHLSVTLNEEEQLEIVHEAIELLLTRQRRKRSKRP